MPNELVDAEGRPVTPSFYRNGQMRPIDIDRNDFYMPPTTQGGDTSWEVPGSWVDDASRVQGAVVAFDPDGDSGAITLGLAQTPQHGHAWANKYVPGDTPWQYVVDRPESVMVGEAGAWQYLSHIGDPYTGPDPFVLRLTDGGGAWTNVTMATNHWGAGFKPIVVDLDRDGIELVAALDSRFGSTSTATAAASPSAGPRRTTRCSPSMRTATAGSTSRARPRLSITKPAPKPTWRGSPGSTTTATG